MSAEKYNAEIIVFTPEEIKTDDILRYFKYDHLPDHLRGRSRLAAVSARIVIDTAPRCPERTVALRKLLEFKDAYVRSFEGKEDA